MIANQLSAELEQRAGTFLAAAQFAADVGHLRAASLVGAAARVARSFGASGVEGYLAAVGDLGTDGDRLARTAIRDALDSTIVRIAADAWLGRLPSSERGLPSVA
jgi:glycine/D-amino acid oxidase-like deaminating enzyme